MVVAIDDLPPLLWHAELGRSLPDVWTGRRQRGVQLHLLRDAVTTWDERYGQRAWVRHLGGELQRHHEDRLMEVIDRFDGRAFPSTLGLARQWAVGRFRRSSSLETVYCAELVATTYQHMGLLPERRPASWYDPGQVLERRPDRARAALLARRRGPRPLTQNPGRGVTWARYTGSIDATSVGVGKKAVLPRVSRVKHRSFRPASLAGPSRRFTLGATR